MSDEHQQKVMERIKRLLALASNNPNENEASAAASKAQELLTEYGISMLDVNDHGKKSSLKRSDQKMGVALYKWQRELWNAVAQLNYCNYWFFRGLTRGSKYEHRVLGSEVNVLGTKLMADYLQQTIERLARERVNGNGALFFTKDSIAYREGIAHRLVERLNQRKYELEQEARAQRANTPANTAFALTILDLADAEADANYDYLHGEGAAAERRARDAKIHADYAARLAEKEAWRKANPELAAAQDAAEKKANAEWWQKNKHKYERRARADAPRHHAFYAGYDKGEEVSLDKQVDGDKRRIK